MALKDIMRGRLCFQCKPERLAKTFERKYGEGITNPSHVVEIFNKIIKSSFSKKEYTFPSGRKENIMGYEPTCIDQLLKEEKIDENDIIVDPNLMPEVLYKKKDGKIGRYYPDILIDNTNRFIEVKSTYYYYKDLDNNHRKAQACVDLGYECEIRVYTDKRKLWKTILFTEGKIYEIVELSMKDEESIIKKLCKKKFEELLTQPLETEELIKELDEEEHILDTHMLD